MLALRIAIKVQAEADHELFSGGESGTLQGWREALEVLEDGGDFEVRDIPKSRMASR
jgi:hypothetical protein